MTPPSHGDKPASLELSHLLPASHKRKSVQCSPDSGLVCQSSSDDFTQTAPNPPPSMTWKRKNKCKVWSALLFSTRSRVERSSNWSYNSYETCREWGNGVHRKTLEVGLRATGTRTCWGRYDECVNKRLLSDQWSHRSEFDHREVVHLVHQE